MMDIGDPIPPLTLSDGDGAQVVLTAGEGRPLVVYFYPKDDTPGCTTEAKDFTALAGDFADADTGVFGISRDTAAKHAKFAAKHALTVSLLADEDGAACEAFGTWVEKSLYGRRYMGIERATFLFDATGTLHRVWHKVRVKGHAADVLVAIRSL